MNRLALFSLFVIIFVIPDALSAQEFNPGQQQLEISDITNSANRSGFHLIADTNTVRGNANQAYSDCGACNGRFHVIAANYFDKNIAWTLVSAPGTYYNCGTPYFVDNHNCIDGDCTFHMHDVSPGEYIIAAQDLDNPDSLNSIVSDTITIKIRAVNNGSVTHSVNDALCNGDSTGSIALQTILNGPITYHWSNGKSTANLINLMAGTYSVTVTDVDKCKIEEVFTINEPAAMQVQPTLINNLIPGPWVGEIQLSINGGTPAYHFNWSNGASTQNIAKLSEGTYMVTITDANNCIENRMYRLGADSIQNTSINEQTSNSLIEVYPNPFTNNINIQFNPTSLTNIHLNVINLLGKTVHTEYLNNLIKTENNIDLKHLPKGIYFLKLTGYRLNKTVRLIKQ